MKQLPAIAHSWFNYINGGPEIKQMMDHRLRICDRCPHKKALSTAGQTLLQIINPDSSIFLCGRCGCPLAGLTAGFDNQCKDTPARWGPWSRKPDTYY